MKLRNYILIKLSEDCWVKGLVVGINYNNQRFTILITDSIDHKTYVPWKTTTLSLYDFEKYVSVLG